MSGWTYPLSSGVNVTELAVKLALGQSIFEEEDVLVEQKSVCAERAFISIPGRLLKFSIWMRRARWRVLKRSSLGLNMAIACTFRKITWRRLVMCLLWPIAMQRRLRFLK